MTKIYITIYLAVKIAVGDQKGLILRNINLQEIDLQ
jgi:hypothetical protein